MSTLPMRVPLVDPKTGMVTREWMYALMGRGENAEINKLKGAVAELKALLVTQGKRLDAVEAENAQLAATLETLWAELDDVQTLAEMSDSGALALALVSELTKRLEGVEVMQAIST